jgi:hypothetical protein
MWPPNCERCLKNLKTFAPPQMQEEDLTLPAMPQTLKKPGHVKYASHEWEEKVTGLLSSGTKPRFESFIRGTRAVAAKSSLQAQKLNYLLILQKEQLESKTTSRKYHKHHEGGLTIDKADRLNAITKRKANAKEAHKQQGVVDRIWREERDSEYRKGV